MVKTATLLLDEEQFRLLTGLSGPLAVFRDASGRAEPDYLLLDAGSRLMLSVDSCDVVFKFEVFGVEPRHLPPDWPVGWDPVATLGPLLSTTCLFRFEWWRPALPGEAPPDWEQMAAGHGPRTAIPDNATAVGVSMVGLLFVGEARSMLAMANNDSPTTFLVVGDPAEIAAVTDTCESADVSDAPRVAAEISSWMRARFGN